MNEEENKTHMKKALETGWMEIKYCGNCKYNKEVPYPVNIPPYVKCRTKKYPFFVNYCSEHNELLNFVELETFVNPPCKDWKEKEE